MMKILKKSSLLLVLLFSFSTVKAQQTDEKSKMLLNALVEVNGGYNKLSSKKDVQFTYVYDNFDKGKDVSVERHIFHGEHSWASYSQHDINVLPKVKGEAVQSLVDGKPQLTLAGKASTNEKALGGTVFLRKVNLYWFAKR